MKESGSKDKRVDVSVVVELLASLRRGDQSIQTFDPEESGALRAIVDEALALAKHWRAQAGTTQALLEEHFSGSLDLLCVANTNGFFKRVNPSFTRILGYTEQELLAQSFFSFIHPDDIASTAKEIESLGAGNLCLNFENRYRCKSGEYRIIAWQARPNSNSRDIFASGRDVTNQKSVEKSLKNLVSVLNETAIVV